MVKILRVKNQHSIEVRRHIQLLKFNRIYLRLREEERDRSIWRWLGSGLFLIRSFYSMLIDGGC